MLVDARLLVAVGLNWTLRDKSTNQHAITSSLVLKPGQYMVLGNNKNVATNGSVKVDYAYSGFYLSNDSDQILLWNSKGVLVDQVEYDTTLGWPLPTGASISLKKPSLNRNLGANWCAEQAAWFGSAGDRGTPGYPAQCLLVWIAGRSQICTHWPVPPLTVTTSRCARASPRIFRSSRTSRRTSTSRW